MTPPTPSKPTPGPLTYYQRHKVQQAEYHRRWRKRNPHMVQKSRVNYRARLFEMLGPFCDFCGESDLVVLTIDHKVPVRHPGRRGPSAHSILAALRAGRENPFNLHVLCANCHQRKTTTERLPQALIARAEGRKE
jgi:5-methylcytosine-specific restriction endonuclease McrA